MAIMKKAQKEDAVSPVIGVMLMLVVTIVIAAVISTFAGSTTGDIEKPPIAVFEVVIDSKITSSDGGMYYEHPSFQIFYKAGDSELDTAKMTIGSSWKDSSGERHSYLLDGSSLGEGGIDGLILRNTENMWGNSDPYRFGNVVLSPGDTMVSYVVWSVCEIPDYDYFEDIFGPDYDTLEKGTEVSLTINYGSTVLFDQVVKIK